MTKTVTNAISTLDDLLRFEDPLVKAELDARILANQSQARIAAEMVLPPEVVAEYEMALFNHRGLSCDDGPAWKEIIGWPDDDILDQYDVRKFWLKLACHSGMYFLRKYLTHVRRAALRKEGLLAYLHRDRRLPIHLKEFAAAAFIPFLRPDWTSMPFFTSKDPEKQRHFDERVIATAYERLEKLQREEEERVKILDQRFDIRG